MIEYKFNQVLTKKDWLEILNDKTITTPDIKAILIKLGKYDDFKTSSSAIGVDFGFKNAGGINFKIYHYSKRIFKFLDIPQDQFANELRDALIELNWIQAKTFGEYADELDVYLEGHKKVSQSIYYERNSQARNKCIEHYGAFCQACGFDFEKVYGSHGEGFIHVHHRRLISESQQEYQVDPIKDLIPLCPNCHAMVHRSKRMLTISELVSIIDKTQN